MALSKKPYRGTRDFFPPQKRLQNYLFSKMHQVATRYGMEPYDGPLLEEVALYLAKSGEELINEQIYSFQDRGERIVAIRPEMTPTLARMVAQIHRETPKPIRWYSIPNLMRYEKPQKGRLREHWQFNADIFGSPYPFGELEILQIIVALLVSFGANETMFAIYLNDRRIVDALMRQILGLDATAAYRLIKIIDRQKKLPAPVFDKMLQDESFSPEQMQIFREYLQLQTFSQVATFLEKYQLTELASSWRELDRHLQLVGLNSFVQYDPAIVRGLDYYTGVVFEVFDLHPDNRRAICGGGAYQDLMKIFAEDPLPGVGFGMGDVTLTDFLQTHQLLPDFSLAPIDLLISFQDPSGANTAVLLAERLRTQNRQVICEYAPCKIKKAFDLAQKRAARWLALIGTRELEQGTIILKMVSGEVKAQQEIPISDLSQILDLIKE